MIRTTSVFRTSNLLNSCPIHMLLKMLPHDNLPACIDVKRVLEVTVYPWYIGRFVLKTSTYGYPYRTFFSEEIGSKLARTKRRKAIYKMAKNMFEQIDLKFPILEDEPILSFH